MLRKPELFSRSLDTWPRKNPLRARRAEKVTRRGWHPSPTMLLPTKDFIDKHDAECVAAETRLEELTTNVLRGSPMVVSVGNPTFQSGGLFRAKIAYYAVRASSREALTEASRTYKDFVLMQKQLAERFVGACIPPVPPEKMMGTTDESFVTKRMHLLEAFLQAITANAFMRNDPVFKLFIKAEGEFSKQTFTSSEESDGVAQWKQALAEATEADDKQILDAASELDVVVKSFVQMKSATKNLIAAAERYNDAQVQLGSAFETWQAREEGQVSLLRGVGQHLDGSKVVLAHEVKGLVTGQTAMAAVLQLEYGPTQLASVLLDAIRFEVAQAEQWGKHLKYATDKNKVHAIAAANVKKLQAQLGVGSKDDKQFAGISKQLQDAKAVLKAAETESTAMRRGVAVELDRYRKDRAIRCETMVALFRRFHLRGANLIRSAWTDGEALEGVNVTALPTAGGGFFKRKSFIRTASGTLKVSKNGSAADVLALELQQEAKTKGESRTHAIVADEKHVRLRCNKDFVARQRDELDLKEGEEVTAVRIDDMMWLATNAQGNSGLVPSSHVGVPPQQSAGSPFPRASIAEHDGLRPRMSIIQPNLPLDGSAPPVPAAPPVHNPRASVSMPPPGLAVPSAAAIAAATAHAHEGPPQPPLPPVGHLSPLHVAPVPPPPFVTSSAPSSDDDEPPPLPAPRLGGSTASAAPPPTHIPAWMTEKRGSFNADLPALPDNAAAMAALKAKLQSMTF